MYRFVSVCIAAFALVAISTPAAAYEPPTNAPLVDNWRPPVDEYGAGNRGVDFGTTVGSSVNAAENGVVSFAGQVGGQNYVVVDHADGLRTTYGGLNAPLVSKGERVNKGSKVGIASSKLHFGVRRGEVYLDPNLLFKKKNKLIPLDGKNVLQRVVISQSNAKVIAASASKQAARDSARILLARM